MILPGLHRVVRGAEVAFEAIASQLAQQGGVNVTLFGSGESRKQDNYKFVHVRSISREYFERWPKLPLFRNEYAYEEFTFLVSLMLMQCYHPEEFDITVTCSYPFMNWFLQYRWSNPHPIHVFVTQNGDYPASCNQREYRYFGCQGLVCTNPEYFERHRGKWHCALIPNGVDPDFFYPCESNRQEFELPAHQPVILMVSALICSKRVLEGVRAVSKIDNAHLVICGDGPEREKVQTLGQELMPNRLHLKKLPRHQMPEIYRVADVFLHMSLDEPSANAYIEALATGLPIVTHNRSVTQWTIQDTGVLVDTTHEIEVINGIKLALSHNSSEMIKTRTSLVKQRFAWKSISIDYYNFFEKILSKKAIYKTI